MTSIKHIPLKRLRHTHTNKSTEKHTLVYYRDIHWLLTADTINSQYFIDGRCLINMSSTTLLTGKSIELSLSDLLTYS